MSPLCNMMYFNGGNAKYLVYAVITYLLIRVLFSLTEWLRTHFLLHKLPQGPQHDFLSGTLKDSTSKVPSHIIA